MEKTPVERCVESGESTMFKSYFFQFDPVLTPAQMKAASTAGGVAGMPEEKQVDFAAMAARGAAAEKAVDDGSGKLEVWRVEDFKKVEVSYKRSWDFFTCS